MKRVLRYSQAHVDLGAWHCPSLQLVEARMRAVAFRAAHSTIPGWPALYRRREAAAEDKRPMADQQEQKRSMAEMARGALSPGLWDNAVCVEMLKNAAAGWKGWKGATAEDRAVAAAAWAVHSKPQVTVACALTTRAHAPWLARGALQRLGA